MRPCHAAAVVVTLTVSLLGSAEAQIVGPGPKQGRLQVGGWRAFLTYDLSGKIAHPTHPHFLARNWKEGRAGLVLRYGMTDGAYAILNFGAWQRLFRIYQGPDLDSADCEALEGVLGAGVNIRLYDYAGCQVRIGGHYNDVFMFDRDRDHGPWRGRDARIALAVDRTWNRNWMSATPSIGILFFSAREKYFTVPLGLQKIRAENRHYFAPITTLLVSVHDRLSVGLELTLGAITDWRWRTEIQL